MIWFFFKYFFPIQRRGFELLNGTRPDPNLLLGVCAPTSSNNLYWSTHPVFCIRISFWFHLMSPPVWWNLKKRSHKSIQKLQKNFTCFFWFTYAIALIHSYLQLNIRLWQRHSEGDLCHVAFHSTCSSIVLKNVVLQFIFIVDEWKTLSNFKISYRKHPLH